MAARLGRGRGLEASMAASRVVREVVAMTDERVAAARASALAVEVLVVSPGVELVGSVLGLEMAFSVSEEMAFCAFLVPKVRPRSCRRNRFCKKGSAARSREGGQEYVYGWGLLCGFGGDRFRAERAADDLLLRLDDLQA